MGKKKNSKKKGRMGHGPIRHQVHSRMAEQTVKVFFNTVISASSTVYTPILIRMNANGITTSGNTFGDVTDFLPATAGSYFQAYAMYRINSLHLKFTPSVFQQGVMFPNYEVEKFSTFGSLVGVDLV
jgi:hypothetical protein